MLIMSNEELEKLKILIKNILQKEKKMNKSELYRAVNERMTTKSFVMFSSQLEGLEAAGFLKSRHGSGKTRIYSLEERKVEGEMEMEEHEEWMEKSERDLHAARVNLQQKLYDVSALLSHQAAEKALKSLYIKRFRRLWKIHNLYDLAESLRAPKDILDICEKLNPHYLATRYPSDAGYTEDRAEEALEFAEKVVEWAKQALKK